VNLYYSVKKITNKSPANFNANYNATGLIHASNDSVVVVTFNFRVGLFGFLASEDIRRDGELNAGLLDQRKAISWVQEHISAFGGDPEKVTLFGTSVGSTLLQTLAYFGEAPPLFSAVITEDPYVPEVFGVPDLDFQYRQFLNATNCTSLACLRDLSSNELEAVNFSRGFPGQSEPPLFAFGPCVDGIFFPDLPSRLIARGRFHPVPLLQGTSTNEGTLFTPNVNNTVQFDDFFTTQSPNLETRDINAQYSYIHLGAEGTGTTSPYFERLAFAYGDSSFSCFGLSFAEALSKAGFPVYSYRYNVLDPTLVGLGLGSPHTFEVEAVWGPGNAVNSAFSSVFKTSPDSYSNVNANIVPVVQAYWTRFAVTHNPNIFKASGSPQWTTWAHGSRLKIQTNDTVMEEADSQQFENCKFWASKSAQLHH
jgi:acetylcholinesterase